MIQNDQIDLAAYHNAREDYEREHDEDERPNPELRAVEFIHACAVDCPISGVLGEDVRFEIDTLTGRIARHNVIMDDFSLDETSEMLYVALRKGIGGNEGAVIGSYQVRHNNPMLQLVVLGVNDKELLRWDKPDSAFRDIDQLESSVRIYSDRMLKKIIGEGIIVPCEQRLQTADNLIMDMTGGLK